MRNSTAYFAGVATVFTATALGFGGALIVTNATAPQAPPEPTKLERQMAHAATLQQPATPQEAKAATTETSVAQAPSPPQPSAPAVQQQQPQPSQQETVQSSAPPPTPAPTDTTAEASKPAVNTYARTSDEDYKKYIRKRERRWARHHYQDDNTTGSVAQDIGSMDKSTDQQASRSSTASQSPAQLSNQPAPQTQAQPAQPQIKSADESSAKVDNVDSGKVSRKQDRRSSRRYARDDQERWRDDDRARSVEVRESPRDEAPHSFFGSPRWRPFSSNDDDD